MGTQDPETTTITSSNPDLQPEDSRAFSAGIVYTPKYVPGLTLSVDLWGIERKGVVTAPAAQEVVQRFLSGNLLPGEMVLLNPGGQSINAIFDAFQNAGRQNARGIDLGLQYQLQTLMGPHISHSSDLPGSLSSGYDPFKVGRSVDNLPIKAHGRRLSKGEGFAVGWAWNGSIPRHTCVTTWI